jgi:hypothetical protein
MTLSTQLSKISFAGNGVTSAFPLPFPFVHDADINALMVSGGAETSLALGTHYTLSGAGASAGGQLTMLAPPATGQTLVIWRAPAIVQEVDYVENSAFPAETHEGALDLLTMICQSLQEQIDRAVRYPVSTPSEDVLGSEIFLKTITSSRDAAQTAESGAVAARIAAQGHAEAAAVSAGSAVASASAAAQAAQAASEIAAGSLPDASTSLKGKVLLAESGGTTAGTVVQATDVRLSDARKCDNTFNDAATARSNLGLKGAARLDVGAVAGTVCAGNDPRLSSGDSLGLFAALKACVNAAEASHSLPGGWTWLFQSDELFKTGAAYDAVNKRYTNPGYATSYANPGGSGDRSGSVTLTLPIGYTNSGTTNLVNGSYADVAGEAFGSNPATGAYFQFDFGSGAAKVISEITWYQNGAYAQGVWKLQGSDDNATWTDLGSSFTLGDASANPSVHPIGATYTKGYRYFRLTKVSGSTNASPYEREVEFKIGSYSTGNATLKNSPLTLGSAPSAVDLYLVHKAVDAVALNTDLKVRASRDGGTTWSGYGTLATVCAFDANYMLLKATCDLSAAASGTSLQFEITAPTGKSQQWRAVAALLK